MYKVHYPGIRDGKSCPFPGSENEPWLEGPGGEVVWVDDHDMHQPEDMILCRDLMTFVNELNRLFSAYQQALWALGNSDLVAPKED